ncbi:MAG: peptidylprolyl isomerase [Mycobacterium sp.]
MPTNEQRRETAKRKLERQLERRAEKARRQRLAAIIGSVLAALVAVAVVVGLVWMNKSKDDKGGAGTATASAAPETTANAGPSTAPAADGKLPPFTASANLGANCQYPAEGTASKPATPPKAGKVPTDPAQVSVSMSTSQGNIGLQLDNAKSPCTVNSFASLAQQGYFNDTPCHRLTTAPGLGVLQCGDPTGLGTGGPGYKFDNEYPTDQYPADAPEAQQPVTYPRGTLAMANAGPGTNGSQFFLVYKESQLPPQYTVFGTIDETGLATLDKIAGAGVKGGGDDGAPNVDVRVKSIQLD